MSKATRPAWSLDPGNESLPNPGRFSHNRHCPCRACELASPHLTESIKLNYMALRRRRLTIEAPALVSIGYAARVYVADLCGSGKALHVSGGRQNFVDETHGRSRVVLPSGSGRARRAGRLLPR
jgi:hypothetical protein